MLGYEWTNPFIISSPHPAVEEQPPAPCHQMFPLYDRSGAFDVPGTIFSITTPPVAASPTAVEEDDYPVRLYGFSQSLPPAEPEPPSGSAMRIGLNLGGRTYFASSPDGELMRLGTNVYRRSGGSARPGTGGVAASMVVVAPACKARCQAEGCGADLTRAKHYHRRHKVCEFHSKAAAVVTHGLTQRFCQQCSRFHVLSEFDQGKRSCRKRLADHNRRRRKTQPPPALPAMSPPPQQDGSSATAAAITNPAPSVAAAKSSVKEGASPGGGTPPAPAATLVAARAASPTRMALGRCFHPADVVPGVNGPPSSSSSSPTSCSSSRSSSSSVLPHVADFGSYYRRVDMSIWDANVDD